MREHLEFVTYGRKDSDCVKWEARKHLFGREDILPLWIADMDIKAPKAVRNAIKETAEDGIYGYYHEPEGYYNAFIQWEQRRHDYSVPKSAIRVLPGIVPALFWCVQMFTKPKDACMTLTPSYGPFLNSILENDRTLITSELVNDGQHYTIDFVDFEEKIIKNNVKLFILCSPHNPTGRVWSLQELTQLFDICKRHNLFVVSDEIHQDIILGKEKQIPFPKVAGDYPRYVMLTAGSKTFNLASLQNAMAILPTKDVQEIYDAFIGKLAMGHNNRIGFEAMMAAYSQGEEWLEEVLCLLRHNHQVLREICAQRAPKLVISSMEGTYLAWIDFGGYLKPEEVEPFLVHQCKVGLNFAHMFYPKESQSVTSHARLNLATSTEFLMDALDAILTQLEQLPQS